MELYIYYRASLDNAYALLQRASAMQQQLARECGVMTELKRRPQATDGMHTWMEVYREMPPNFLTSLNAAIDACQLESLITGPRHLEYFMDLSFSALIF